MAVDDLWRKRGPGGKLIPSQQDGVGKRWRVRYTDPSGQTTTRRFERKTDADAFDLRVRSEVASGQYVDPNAGREPFRIVAERWRANRPHRPNTVRQINSLFGRHVYEYFGDRGIKAIRRSDVQGLLSHMAAGGLSPATIEVTYRHVCSVFKSAVLDGDIPASPCVKIGRTAVPKKRLTPMLFGAVEQLREATAPRYRAGYDLAELAGLRHGEAFGIEVDHINFLRRTVRVEQQIIHTPGRPPFLAPPKTDKSRRVIPVGKVLVDRLAAHLAAFPAVPVEIEDRTSGKPVVRTAKLLTLTETGRPVRHSTHSQYVWQPACEAVGLTGPTFHDLRHFYASALIRAGLSVTVVSERLGHADASMTLNVYSHLWPDDEDRTRQATDDLFQPQTPRLRKVD